MFGGIDATATIQECRQNLMSPYFVQLLGRIAPPISGLFSSAIIVRSGSLEILGQFALAIAIGGLAMGALLAAQDLVLLRAPRGVVVAHTYAAKLVIFGLTTPVVIAAYLLAQLPILDCYAIHAALLFQSLVETHLTAGRRQDKDVPAVLPKLAGSALVPVLLLAWDDLSLAEVSLVYLFAWSVVSTRIVLGIGVCSASIWSGIRALNASQYVVGSGALSQLYGTVDLLIVNAFWTAAETGLYRVAQAISSPAMILYGATSTVFLSRHQGEPRESINEDLSNRVSRQVLLHVQIGVAMIAVCAFACPVFLSIVYNISDGSASTVATLMVLAYSIGGVAMVYSYALLAIRKDRVVMTYTFVGAVMSVGMNMWLVPIWGAVGGSITLVATHVVMMLLACRAYGVMKA